MAALTASKRFVAATRRAAKSGALFALAIMPVMLSTGARGTPIETEHLFGFTIGSDVGEVGERELEGTVTGRHSKQTGTYGAAEGTFSAEFVPIPNLRPEITGAAVGYN